MGIQYTPTEVKAIRNSHTRIYAVAAIQQRFELNILDENVSRIKVSHEDKSLIITNAQPSCNTPTLCRLAHNKYESYKKLSSGGHSVPKFELFKIDDFADIQALKLSILNSTTSDYPKVIKPLNGCKGRGVFIVNDSDELDTSLNILIENNAEQLLLEEFIQGRHYRVVTCQDTVIDVLERNPASVTGDGQSTISQLISKMNKRRRKFRMGQFFPKMHGLTQSDLEIVLDKDASKILTGIVNYSRGGTTSRIDLKQIHPDNIQLFEAISRTAELVVNGLDIIMPDILTSHHDQHYAINEINQAPGQNIHYLADMALSTLCAEGILAQYFS